MSEFLSELDESVQLLKHPMITKDLARAYVRSEKWFREHADEVERAGWSIETLYRVGRLAFPYSEWGPGWLTLWNNDKSEPRLGSRGDIEFVLHEAGGNVVQTCWLHKGFLA
jgi:hypothetical protein